MTNDTLSNIDLLLRIVRKNIKNTNEIKRSKDGKIRCSGRNDPFYGGKNCNPNPRK